MNNPIKAPIKWRQHLSLDLPEVSASPLWIHACSVGEVASVAPLIRTLVQQGMPLHLTVVTKTGMQHAQRCFSENVSISYLPWDLPTRCAKLLKHIKPRALLIAETEFWPGLLSAAKKNHVPVVSINARVSDRSFPRYQKTAFYWKRVLSGVQLFLAQSDLDAQRLQAIGVPSQRIQTVGNLKYATPRPDVDLAALQQTLDPSKKRPIIVLASSHDDEEKQILEHLAQWQSQCPNLLLVIVPRHPQRFDAVAELIHDFGFSMKRWSKDEVQPVDVLLMDAMGVLNQLYAICDIAIIAGSLSNIGGHNPLEAAIWGKGVVTGPHVQNFREIMQEMQQQGAAIICKDKKELANSVCQLLQNDSQRLHLHQAAQKVMCNKSSILQKTLKELHKIVPSITT